MLLFGAGLFLAQLVIFNLAMNFVGTADRDSQQAHSTSSVHQISLQGFQQSNRKRPINKMKKRNSAVDSAAADGTFGGYPIYIKQTSEPLTRSHCVGEDYQPHQSWKRKSCHFEFICFDTSVKEFVVYQSAEEERIAPLVDTRPFVDISQSYLNPGLNRSNFMSLGGINLKWGMDKAKGIRRLRWFPEIRKAPTDGTLSYYELPSSVVMIPFHSMNGANPGHLVWDDFLPVYTLLTMFQLEEDSELLMMRYVLKDGRGLWASCDFTHEKTVLCEKMHRKFLPLMVGLDSIKELMTTEKFVFEPKGEAKSNLVCARHGVAGFGALTDHGPTKLHGWEEGDYKITQNHGRGGMLYEFRNFMMSNIGVPFEFGHTIPFRIVFSEKSSDIPTRDLDFRRHMDVLRRSFNPSLVTVESYVFKDIPLVQQVDIASQTTIYISGVGGGAVTATFLPRGASVFLYFLESGGVENGRETGKPARLDWDLFNNIGYLKVHWLPIGTMQKEADLRSLIYLVQHELDALVREQNYEKYFY